MVVCFRVRQETICMGIGMDGRMSYILMEIPINWEGQAQILLGISFHIRAPKMLLSPSITTERQVIVRHRQSIVRYQV